MQLSFLDGDEFEYTYFVTDIEISSEIVVIAYEKRGNAEKTIKEAKYGMVVSHLLLQSLWVNKATFQLMMLAYFFSVQDRFCKLNRIPAADQDI